MTLKCQLCDGDHLSASVHSYEELKAWEDERAMRTMTLKEWGRGVLSAPARAATERPRTEPLDVDTIVRILDLSLEAPGDGQHDAAEWILARLSPPAVEARAAAHATERPDHRPITEALAALADAYYAIPAGSPTREQVDERLPALYAAIEAVLSDASRIGGLLATVGDAEANDLPIHVATGATCAEHDRAATERPRTEPLDVRQAIEEISGELSHYDLSDDPGYIKIPTERVRAILRARLSPPAATQEEE